MNFGEIISIVFGSLFAIGILWMFFAVPISEIKGRRYKNAITTDRLKEENQLLKDEITHLKQENKTLLSEINAKDTLIYNLGLDFSNHDSSALIPPHLYGAYMRSVCTEKLEKAFIDDVCFLSLSATVLSSEEKTIPSTPEEEKKAKTYHTTLRDCTCENFRSGHTVCKHMLALALHTHALTPYESDLRSLLSRLIEQNQKNAELLKEKAKLNKKAKKQ